MPVLFKTILTKKSVFFIYHIIILYIFALAFIKK